MKAPQIIIIVWFALALGVALATHGKLKEGKNNVGYSIISAAIEIGLLYWGGFFS